MLQNCVDHYIIFLYFVWMCMVEHSKLDEHNISIILFLCSRMLFIYPFVVTYSRRHVHQGDESHYADVPWPPIPHLPVLHPSPPLASTTWVKWRSQPCNRKIQIHYLQVNWPDVLNKSAQKVKHYCTFLLINEHPKTLDMFT